MICHINNTYAYATVYQSYSQIHSLTHIKQEIRQNIISS